MASRLCGLRATASTRRAPRGADADLAERTGCPGRGGRGHEPPARETRQRLAKGIKVKTNKKLDPTTRARLERLASRFDGAGALHHDASEIDDADIALMRSEVLRIDGPGVCFEREMRSPGFVVGMYLGAIKRERIAAERERWYADRTASVRTLRVDAEDAASDAFAEDLSARLGLDEPAREQLLADRRTRRDR